MKHVYCCRFWSPFDGPYNIGFYTNRREAELAGVGRLKELCSYAAKYYGANWREDVRIPSFSIIRVPLNRDLDVNDGFHGIV